MKYVILALILIVQSLLLFSDGGAKTESNPQISPGKLDYLEPEQEDKPVLAKPEQEEKAELPESEEGNFVTWSEEIHYLERNIYLKGSETLRISPGTKVIATGNYGITVEANATIEALGTYETPIEFAVDYDYDGNFGESLNGQSLEYWQGIKFQKGGDKENPSIFFNCLFFRSWAEQNPDKSPDQQTTNSLFRIEGDCEVIFENCRFEENNYFGQDFITAKYSDIEIRGCHFQKNNAGIRLENSILNMSNITCLNNTNIGFALYKVETKIEYCNFTNNRKFHLLARQKHVLRIDNCTFTDNDNDQDPLISINDLKQCFLENTILNDNKTLAVECNNTDLYMEHCLISGYTMSSALKFNSEYGKTVAKIINCNIIDNSYQDESVLQIGNDIILIVINSIFKENQTPEIRIIPSTGGSSFYALNSVISQQTSLQNEFYRMKAEWQEIINPIDIADCQDSRLRDRGWQQYISGETEIFSLTPDKYIGKAPDIGFYEN